jgi:hypothetical protein
MLHMRDAGFKFDIATATGKPVVLEMWAYPTKDTHVAELHKEIAQMMEAPKKLIDIVSLDPEQRKILASERHANHHLAPRLGGKTF